MSHYKIRPLAWAFTALLAGSLATQAWADRTVTDQLGRQVTLPDTVNRVVVLQHQSLDILVQLNANDKIVGVLSSWKKHLGPNFERFIPKIATLPEPGDLTSVNIESLIAAKPDVVIVTNYAPQDMIAKIEQAKIPVVAISLREYVPGQADKVNPSVKDEEQMYTVGLKQAVTLIGEVVNRSHEAKALNDWVFSHRAKVLAFKNQWKGAQTRTYVANPDLYTYGSGKFVGVMMNDVNANNVAASAIKGWKQVSMEQVLTWNPQVIFVQNRFPQVIEAIKNDPKFKPIDAMKNDHLYLMPEYVKAWGYPTPEAMGLGELWLGKKLYPSLYQHFDMDKLAQEYYQRFYRVSWKDSPKSAKE